LLNGSDYSTTSTCVSHNGDPWFVVVIEL